MYYLYSRLLLKTRISIVHDIKSEYDRIFPRYLEYYGIHFLHSANNNQFSINFLSIWTDRWKRCNRYHQIRRTYQFVFELDYFDQVFTSI